MARAASIRKPWVDPRSGHVSHAYLGDVTADGIEIWHRQSRQPLLLSWNEAITQGAIVFGETPEQFLERLRRIALTPPTRGQSALPEVRSDNPMR